MYCQWESNTHKNEKRRLQNLHVFRMFSNSVLRLSWMNFWAPSAWKKVTVTPAKLDRIKIFTCLLLRAYLNMALFFSARSVRRGCSRNSWGNKAGTTQPGKTIPGTGHASRLKQGKTVPWTAEDKGWTGLTLQLKQITVFGTGGAT